MENEILLKRLAEIKGLRLNKHNKSERFNGECITKKTHHRRKNVIGDISPTGRSFILYHNGEWISKNKLGIQTVEEAIDWVKRDIEFLSK
ncbi:MAG: hypothetical protein ACQEWW_04150 [Bacillota bacterium]